MGGCPVALGPRAGLGVVLPTRSQARPMLLLVAAPNGSDISSTRGRQARGFTEAGFHNRGNVCAQQSWPSLEAVSPSDMGAHPTFVPAASPHQPQSLCSLDSEACRVLATQSHRFPGACLGLWDIPGPSQVRCALKSLTPSSEIFKRLQPPW